MTQLLAERLKTIEGRVAIPLLNSLRLRTDLAAADPTVLPSLVRLADAVDPLPDAPGAML